MPGKREDAAECWPPRDGRRVETASPPAGLAPLLRLTDIVSKVGSAPAAVDTGVEEEGAGDVGDWIPSGWARSRESVSTPTTAGTARVTTPTIVTKNFLQILGISRARLLIVRSTYCESEPMTPVIHANKASSTV